MLAAVVWVMALVIEYQYGLRPPGNGSRQYKADQAAFFLAQVGYLAMLIGLFLSRAGGDGRFGRAAIGIWTIAVAAIVLAQALGVVGVTAVFLLPIGGVGQILGSVLTSVAVWRAGRWTGWRRFAPAIWTVHFLCHHRGGCCSHSVPLDPCRCAQSSCAQPSGRSAVAGGLVPAQPRALHRSRPQTRVGVKKKAGHKGRPFRFESKSGQLQPVVAPQFRHL